MILSGFSIPLKWLEVVSTSEDGHIPYRDNLNFCLNPSFTQEVSYEKVCFLFFFQLHNFSAFYISNFISFKLHYTKKMVAFCAENIVLVFHFN